MGAADELNAVVQVFNKDNPEDFKKYQELLDKVTFDQSLFGIKHFGIGEQGTIHRKLRHCLLQYDGKCHALMEAENGLKKTRNKLKLSEIAIKKLTKKMLATEDELEKEELEIKIDDEKLEIDKTTREVMQQQKLVKDAQEQIKLYKTEIDRLVPLVEADGRTFEEAENDYWKFRFLRDIECQAKAALHGIDQGVVQSISQLPQSTQEEIFKEANKITLSLKGGGMPYEFAYRSLGEGGSKQMLAIGESKVNDPSIPDLIIGCLKRNEHDVCVTDVKDMLIIPGELNHDVHYVWGYPADTARNMVIQKSLELGAKYVFFIDDDTLVPRNALAVLYDYLQEQQYQPDKVVGAVGGHYYKKTEPLESAHLIVRNGKTVPVRPDGTELIYCDGILAAGCLLIDLAVCRDKGMTLPYFMELREQDGNMLATDDLHFTRKLLDFGLAPMLHMGVKCLHIDKANKRVYGERSDVPYAVNDIDVFQKNPLSEKKIAICVPFRKGDGPENMATKFKDIYTPKGFSVIALLAREKPVAEARNFLVKEAQKENADYIFFIDDDVKIPGQALVEMLKFDADIIACPYPLKQPGYTEAMLMLHAGQVVPLDRWEALNPVTDLVVPSNWVVTMGCTLIKMSVFNNLREPWFWECKDTDNEYGRAITEDAYFTEKAIHSGFTPYVHLGLRCFHIDREKNAVYNKPGYKLETRIVNGIEIEDIVPDNQA